jgi:hypothetical protein
MDRLDHAALERLIKVLSMLGAAQDGERGALPRPLTERQQVWIDGIYARVRREAA